jgi:hypothetical protein
MSDNFSTIIDPSETLDFVIDWSAEMAASTPADQLSTSTWALTDVAADDLTLGADSIVGTDHTKIRVSDGGRIGTTHYLTNTVVTIGGTTHIRTIKVKVARR